MVHGDYAIAIIRVSGFQVAEPEPDICFEVGVFDFKTPNSKPGQLTPTPQVSAYKELGSKMWGFQRSSKIPPALLGFCRVLEHLQNLKKVNLEPETLDHKSRGNTPGLPGFAIFPKPETWVIKVGENTPGLPGSGSGFGFFVCETRDMHVKQANNPQKARFWGFTYKKPEPEAKTQV